MSSAAASAMVAALPAPAKAHRPLELGLTDGMTFASADGALWLNKAVEAQADHVLLGASWRAIAPQSKRRLRSA